MARASCTLLPRRRSHTSRALRADVRTYLAWARTTGRSMTSRDRRGAAFAASSTSGGRVGRCRARRARLGFSSAGAGASATASSAASSCAVASLASVASSSACSSAAGLPSLGLPGLDGLMASAHPSGAGVAAERPRGRELAQLVADHRLGDEHGHVLAAVVDRDRVPDHLREDRRRARPGPHHLAAVGLVHGVDAAHEALLDPRALLARSAHRLDFFPRRRPRTMKRSDALCFLRVRYPSVGTPHGVTGWRPGVVEPSPPPCGWSTGFIAVPRVCGRLPLWRLRPALPMSMFWWSELPIAPIEARESTGTWRISPEGSRSVARSPSFATSWISTPAERPSWPPLPGISSTLWTMVPVGIRRSGSALPTVMSAISPLITVMPTRRRFGARM